MVTPVIFQQWADNTDPFRGQDAREGRQPGVHGEGGGLPHLDGDSRFHMINVAEKAPTRRRAVAEGQIHMSLATLRRIRDLKMPKGDVLAMAEVAGVMAAKKTSEILPLCHPLPLEAVRVRCKIGDESILVSCEVLTTGKTGVEMEALTAVSAALLSIYDLTKGIDPVLSISGIRLRTKEGGKGGKWIHPELSESRESSESFDSSESSASSGSSAKHKETSHSLNGFSAAVLTMSDRCFAGGAQDLSGPIISKFLLGEGANLVQEILVPDDKKLIQSAVLRLAQEEKVDVIFTTGGTGMGPRDTTPDALAEIWDRKIPGIGEFLRQEGARSTPMSWLSRGEAGLIGTTLVISLPGSPNAAREGTSSLRHLLPHALAMIQGKNHDAKDDANHYKHADVNHDRRADVNQTCDVKERSD